MRKGNRTLLVKLILIRKILNPIIAYVIQVGLDQFSKH